MFDGIDGIDESKIIALAVFQVVGEGDEVTVHMLLRPDLVGKGFVPAELIEDELQEIIAQFGGEA
jgi:hypothetical protein